MGGFFDGSFFCELNKVDLTILSDGVLVWRIQKGTACDNPLIPI